MQTIYHEGKQLSHKLKEGMVHREQVKDRKLKHSIFDIQSSAPYSLNVFDRDYLIQALIIYKANMYSKQVKQIETIWKHTLGKVGDLSKNNRAAAQIAKRFTLQQNSVFEQAQARKTGIHPSPERKKKPIVNDKVESHIEVMFNRLKAIVDSRIFRKIFSASFFAFIALIKNGGINHSVDPEYTFVTLIQFIFKKHLSLIAKLK